MHNMLRNVLYRWQDCRKRRMSEECLTDGPLSPMLLVSLVLGVAPLRASLTLKGHWRCKFSSPMVLYSFVFLLSLHAIIIFGLVRDYNLDPSKAIMMRCRSSRIIIPIGIGMIMLFATIIVFEAPSRTKNIIKCLIAARKIQSQLFDPPRFRTAHYYYFFVGVSLALYPPVHFVYTHVLVAIDEDRDLLALFLISFYTLEYIMISITVLQFIFVSLKLKDMLENVNDLLLQLVSVMNLKAMSEDEIKDVIHHMARCFGGACDLIRFCHKGFGIVILLVTCTLFEAMVLIPYQFVSYVVGLPNRRAELIVQIGAFSARFLFMMMACQSGFRTEDEIERARVLVSQMLCCVSSPHDPLAPDVDYLSKQVELNKISYSPLGVFTLNRYLITSLFGVGTTLSVLVLQCYSLQQGNTAKAH